MPREAPDRRRGSDRGSAGHEVSVCWAIRQSWGAERILRKAALAALRRERVRRAQLSIAVVGRRRMRRLHRQFMGLDSATDVLTFDLREEPRTKAAVGEIVVCADVARRRAAAPSSTRTRGTRRAAVAELALYVVHGVLHLCGYDDHLPEDSARMHLREDEILRGIGLGPVFSRRQSRAARGC